ncbi:Rho-N domain-containing protein 1 chloroplastic [Bienertia sinuspersici]
MSRTLNIISNNVQGYGQSDSTYLPCLGVSGRAVNVSTCPSSEFKTAQMKMIMPNCSLKHMSFICKANTGGHRRNSDFSKPNRSAFSRNRNRSREERDNSESPDESEFLPTKNGPLLSLSNSPKSHATATPGPKEREIVELFRKVQAQLRQRAAAKEEKKVEALKGQHKESETVDSLLKLLRKHSVEQGKRKVNGGAANDFTIDHPRQSGQSNEDKNKGFFNSNSIVKEEPQETYKPSYNRPPSSFRRKSPVPRVKYEPIVSHSNLDVKENETVTQPEPDPESESYLEPEMDLVSELELEQEEDREEEADAELDTEEAEIVDELKTGKLSESEFIDVEEDDYDESDAVKEHTDPKDLNVMKLSELRALAKARGMKRFSKLKKSELVGLLSEDFM